MLWAKRDSYDNKGIAKLAMLPSQQRPSDAFENKKSEEKADKHGGKYNAWEEKGE